MKKVIALLALLCGGHIVAHAVTPQNTQQAPSSATENPITTTQPTVDSIGLGSGDDMSTPDEGDPSNDKDPEADEGS